MNHSENFSQEQWDALTPEQQDEARRIEREVDKFLGDSKSIRYIESDGNKNSLLSFLEAHNLQITHANLLFAYDSLCADGALELIPLAPVVERPPAPAPTQPPTPIPTAPDPRAPQMFRNGRAIPYTTARPI